MRRRHQTLLALLFVANAGVALSFAVVALVDQALPLPALASGLMPGPAAGSPVPTAAPSRAVDNPAQVAAGTTRAGSAEAPLATLLPTATPFPTPADTATPLPTVSPELFLPLPAERPASAQVIGVVGRRQSLPLSCEARSAADWAAFFGVAIDELEFLSRLPVSDDPDRGFVGDVLGTWGQLPPQAYGVHAGPVARLLAEYGLRAEARRYTQWDVVQAELAAGRPVIAWVVGHVEGGVPEIYTAADGRETIVARFEHTVILVGYSADTVTVLDGAQSYERPLARFLESWDVLRNMVVTFDG